MKWITEDDIANGIMTIISSNQGILTNRITSILNEGEEAKERIVGQFLVSKLIDRLVEEGKVRTVFLSGLIWRVCYTSDYPIVLTIGEKKEAATSLLLSGAAALKRIEEGDAY